MIFKFDPDPAELTFTKLIQACDYEIYGLTGDLIQASNDKLYGMFQDDEIDGYGGVFEYDLGTIFIPPSFSYELFNGTNGNEPWGSLIEGSTYYKLYGMTRLGGSNGKGNIFEYRIDINTFNNQLSFNSTNGGHPWGNLCHIGSDTYYGLTYDGGTYDEGILFKYENSDMPPIITTIQNFGSGQDGASPMGSLMIFSDDLYGMTTQGGSNNEGTIIKYIPDDTYSKLVNFQCSDDKGLINGITEATGNDDLIFPNPASNYIIINNSRNAHIQIYDLLGTKVMDVYNISNEYRMDVSSLVQGNYIVRILQIDKVVNIKISLVK